jgi:hypothetical protein
MTFNQLHPPFDNPAIRRALLGAVDQAEAATDVARRRAIGDGDNDGLQCGSLKNTSQLMLSTRNANLNSMGWRR